MPKVQLYVYDLSGGLAVQLSPMFLGKGGGFVGCCVVSKDLGWLYGVPFVTMTIFCTYSGKQIDGIW